MKSYITGCYIIIMKQLAMYVFMNTFFISVSNSYFVPYDAGDIYGFMEKERNRTTTTPQKPECDELIDFLPKMMIIEPDGVLWPFNVETDVVKPFAIKEFRELTDSNGTLLTMHKDSVEVIVHLIKKGIKVAVAETTREIIVMRHLLHLFDIDHLVDFMELDMESAVDHVKTIKGESGFDYDDLIYFGPNTSALNEIKATLNLTTIYVNPRMGLDFKHIYQAIYIYNIKPYTQMVDDSAKYFGRIVSKEENAQEEMKVIFEEANKRKRKEGNIKAYSRTTATLPRKTLKRIKTEVPINFSKRAIPKNVTHKVQRLKARTKMLKQKTSTAKKISKTSKIAAMSVETNSRQLKQDKVQSYNMKSKRKTTKSKKDKSIHKPEVDSTMEALGSGGNQVKIKTAQPKIKKRRRVINTRQNELQADGI